ncbi:MAG: hypothetical protein ACRDLM_03795 [Gaiellaceae bacterium]
MIEENLVGGQLDNWAEERAAAPGQLLDSVALGRLLVQLGEELVDPLDPLCPRDLCHAHDLPLPVVVLASTRRIDLDPSYT